MAFGKPLQVEQGITEDEFEAARLEIETEMLRISQQVEDRVAQLKGEGQEEEVGEKR